MILEEFNYTLEHTRGNNNEMADSLSRLCTVTQKTNLILLHKTC
jgi:hypothetical protein